VGLFGLSWGGFNGLQIAAMDVPEVGAVVTVCSSDNRYSDDVHYMGGCLLTDNLSWASTMFAFNSLPPDPAIVGNRWRDMWLERLEGSGLWIEKWLRHQRRDSYWSHGSVCDDYSAINAPVMAVSGWADGYTNSVFRLMQHLKVPRRGLIGAWAHAYPHQGSGPGPAIDFLGECLLWWDRWLKNIDNGIDREPMIRCWMQDPSSPLTADRPGRWVGEESWPSPRIDTQVWHLDNRTLTPEASGNGDAHVISFQSPLSCGLFAGKWASYASETDLPWDQRAEDGGSLVFDTEPLQEDLEILGAPEVDLCIAADKPIAQVAVRLCNVAPNDRAARITFGILNLTHRNSHQNPELLEPGEFYRVRVPMNFTAQRFARGDRVRLAISSSYWPLAWPSPEPARLSFDLSRCRLHLPARRPRPEDVELRSLGWPRMAAPPGTTVIAPDQKEWLVTHNLAANEVALNIRNDDVRFRLDDIDLVVGRETQERYKYSSNRYDTLRGSVTSERAFRRGDWDIVTRTRTVLSATRSHFQVRATLDAYEGDLRVFAKSWDESIPRDMM
jgi:hypothetical protein